MRYICGGVVDFKEREKLEGRSCHRSCDTGGVRKYTAVRGGGGDFPRYHHHENKVTEKEAVGGQGNEKHMGGRGGRVFFFGAAPADLARRAKNKMLNIFFLRLLAFMLYLCTQYIA